MDDPDTPRKRTARMSTGGGGKATNLPSIHLPRGRGRPPGHRSRRSRRGSRGRGSSTPPNLDIVPGGSSTPRRRSTRLSSTALQSPEVIDISDKTPSPPDNQIKDESRITRSGGKQEGDEGVVGASAPPGGKSSTPQKQIIDISDETPSPKNESRTRSGGKQAEEKVGASAPPGDKSSTPQKQEARSPKSPKHGKRRRLEDGVDANVSARHLAFQRRAEENVVAPIPPEQPEPVAEQGPQGLEQGLGQGLGQGRRLSPVAPVFQPTATFIQSDLDPALYDLSNNDQTEQTRQSHLQIPEAPVPVQSLPPNETTSTTSTQRYALPPPRVAYTRIPIHEPNLPVGQDPSVQVYLPTTFITIPAIPPQLYGINGDTFRAVLDWVGTVTPYRFVIGNFASSPNDQPVYTQGQQNVQQDTQQLLPPSATSVPRRQNQPSGKVRCYICGCKETFDKIALLKEHVEKVHPVGAPLQRQCKICKNWVLQEHWTQHMRRHREEKIQCDVAGCQAKFVSVQERDAHRAIVHPEFLKTPPQLFKVPDCLPGTSGTQKTQKKPKKGSRKSLINKRAYPDSSSESD